jgi:hypothetical protein
MHLSRFNQRRTNTYKILAVGLSSESPLVSLAGHKVKDEEAITITLKEKGSENGRFRLEMTPNEAAILAQRMIELAEKRGGVSYLDRSPLPTELPKTVVTADDGTPMLATNTKLLNGKEPEALDVTNDSPTTHYVTLRIVKDCSDLPMTEEDLKGWVMTHFEGSDYGIVDVMKVWKHGEQPPTFKGEDPALEKMIANLSNPKGETDEGQGTTGGEEIRP